MEGSFRKSSRAIGVALAGVLPGLFGLAAWAQVPTQYTLTQLGLTGGAYEFTSNGGIHRLSVTQQLNAAGQVTGAAYRYDAGGGSLGQDAWLYTGSDTRRVGLIGSGYEISNYQGSGRAYREGYVKQLNAAGQTTGYSVRYGTGGSALGADAWLHTGLTAQVIGLTGNGYAYDTGGGTFRSSSALQLNSAGQVVGESRRYDGRGLSFGQDVWFYNGSSTQLIGLTGSGYGYNYVGGTVRVANLGALNTAGHAVGITNRYAAAGHLTGQDAWLFNGSATQLVGLSGPGYEYTSGGETFRWGSPGKLNEAGQVAGASRRYTASGGYLGYDAWLYTGGSWKVVGLTGNGYEYAFAGGTRRESIAGRLSAVGHISGRSLRYNATGRELGYDAWLYDGATTQRVGLTGGVYEYAFTGTGGGTYRHSVAYPLNDDVAQVAGFTYRYGTSGQRLGADAWLHTGSTTRLIGLTGDGYEYGTGGGTYRQGLPSHLNAAGQVAGYTRRYSASGDPLGVAGWFYEDETNTTSALEFSFRSGDNFSVTSPQFLTDAGVVLGTYELFSGTSNLGERAFWWSAEAGFYDLGGLVDGGLGAAGWQYLADVYGSVVPGAAGVAPGGSSRYIVGTGLTIGQTGGQSGYLLTAVPEPTSLTLVAIGACAASRPRRRTVHSSR